MMHYGIKTTMNYQDFYSAWHSLGCFSTAQLKAIYPDFNRGNLLQWQRKHYILPLRQGWYSFADYMDKPDYDRYIASRIYEPSYISLHTALAYYGMIPEAVVAITSVTTRKTATFTNRFATYTYQSIHPSLFSGYEPKKIDEKSFLIATPEKALMDLLYLYDQYATPDDMRELRLDDYFMQHEFNRPRLRDYMDRMAGPALTKRIHVLLKTYDIDD